MHYRVAVTADARRMPMAALHLAFFSILFLMLVSLAPTMSWSYGTCSGKMAQLDGPLLPELAKA